VFAFGVMAFEVLAGDGPFVEPPAVARGKGLPFTPCPPLRSKNAEVDGAIGRLVERCLAEEPAERPAARELAAAFRAYAERVRKVEWRAVATA
jgi:hypothetical protein